MSLKPKKRSGNGVQRGGGRRRRRSGCLGRSSLEPRICNSVEVGKRDFSKVSDKLEALKSLIPAQTNNNGNNCNGDLKADRLFQETADYIILLRTQVTVLQRLIEFYGSSNENGEDSV